jgi:hypothetical protein
VIAHPVDRLERTIDLFYDHVLELASRLNEMGEVISTITNRRVAAIRLRLDRPRSAYFFNTETGLRIDLLFDFPIPAEKLAQHATRTRIRSHAFTIASKRISCASRGSPMRRVRRRATPRTLPFSSHAGNAPRRCRGERSALDHAERRFQSTAGSQARHGRDIVLCLLQRRFREMRLREPHSGNLPGRIRLA